MCAFIPANANWSGAIPRLARDWNSGGHACGAVLGSRLVGVDRVEEQLRERDVEPLEEPRVLEAPCRRDRSSTPCVTAR